MVHDNNTVDLVTDLYRCYNERDMEGWLAHFDEESVWKNIPTGQEYSGPEGQKENYAAWNTPFPRGKCNNLVIRGGNDVVVAEFVGEGVHEGPLLTPDGPVEPTFKESSIAFCDVHSVAEGRIVETHRYWDLAAAAAQLGF